MATEAEAPSRPKMELDPKHDDYDFPTTAPTPQKGHPGHTTPQEDAQVYQLRSMLEQAGYKDRLDTLTMLRFLRARKFNVEQSKQMFIDCEKWRKEFGGVGVDELVRTFEYTEKPQVFEYYPQYYHKTDKDGRPVYIEQLGKIDIKKMYQITSGDRMLQNLVVEYEKMADPRLPACSRKAGQLLETSCSILDMKGVGISSAPSVYSYLQQTSAISQNYYPERLGKMYILNAPWGFSTVFSFVKKFLDPVTVAKIHVLGSGYEKELLEQVPKENLPRLFGGECECDGGCALSDAGPWQDPEWYKPPKWARSGADGAAGAAIDNSAGADLGEGVQGPESKGGTTAGDAAPAPAAEGEGEAAKDAAAKDAAQAPA